MKIEEAMKSDIMLILFLVVVLAGGAWAVFRMTRAILGAETIPTVNGSAYSHTINWGDSNWGNPSCKSLVTMGEGLSAWDFTNVTPYAETWPGCTNLTTLGDLHED